MNGLGDIIKEVFKLLDRWIFRDFFYLLGGLIVIWSIQTHYDILGFMGTGVWQTLGLIGVGYAIGYAITELAGFTFIGRTAVVRPKAFGRWLVKHHWPGHDYTILPPQDWARWHVLLAKGGAHELKPQIERINRLKHLCVSMGSTLLVASIFLSVSGSMRAMSVFSVIVSLLLLVLGRIHLYHEHELETHMVWSIDSEATKKAMGADDIFNP